ncbi:GntR family transcriptional regulator [Cryptosporangium arvum]|uniref:GntR family transcriptional regulator n=1 Tax=Cryptosporangium arvum TaxID=80871 RepID=UPI001B80828D|nr:GntR family transcriptional regulator [Cryptosporangium arvum]
MIVTRAEVGASGVEFVADEAGGLSRPTSAQQVAAHIRRMIFDQRLRAGERVPQDEIAAELRVSRVPVREAVIALDREGWVTSRPHLGAFVNGLDENSVRDHYELLGLMYGLAARRAVERGTEEGIAALAETAKELQATNDADAFAALNTTFLRQVLVLASSRRISAVARVITTNIVPGNFFAQVPGVIRIHKRGMRAIVKALKAGDGTGAEAAFVDLLRAETDSVVSLLEQRGLLS